MFVTSSMSPVETATITTAISPLKSCMKDPTTSAQSKLGASLSSMAITEATSSDEDDDSDSGFMRKVVFDKIQIREYPQILGDNPAVTDGAPVTLDWDYQNEYSINIEMYEFTRNPMRRKSRKKLMISSQKRVRTVIEAGHGIEEIGEVIMAVQKCKSERLKSVQAFGWNGPLDFLSGAVDTTMVATFRTMKRRGSKILKESIHSAIEGLGIKKLQPRRRSYSNPAC